MFILKLFMKYSVLLEKVHIIAVWREKKRNKNISDVIVLPPSGPPLLHQCLVMFWKTRRKICVLFKNIKRKCIHFAGFEWLLICTASLVGITVAITNLT